MRPAEPTSPMYRRILLANDGSMNASGALEPALALAEKFAAELTMLIVAKLPRIPISMGEVDDAKSGAEAKCAYIISAARQRAEVAQVAFHGEIALGSFVERTLAFLHDHPAELLVVAGGKSATRPVPSSGAIDRLVHLAPCSVHLVKS